MRRADATNPRRQAEHRKRLVESGGRRVSVDMPARINRLLATEMARTGESAQAVILRLLCDSLG